MSSVHEPSLRDWLESIHLPQYLDVFVNNGYDTLHKCAVLTYDDLDNIGISLTGHKKRIMSQLAKFSLKLEYKSAEFAEVSQNHSLSDTGNTDDPEWPDIPREEMLVDAAKVDASIADSL